MPTFMATIEAYIAAKEYDQATRSRLSFWADEFGGHELADITPDEVDAAIVRLAEHGKLRAGKFPTERTGKPLANSTLNRYIKQLG